MLANYSSFWKKFYNSAQCTTLVFVLYETDYGREKFLYNTFKELKNNLEPERIPAQYFKLAMTEISSEEFLREQ